LVSIELKDTQIRNYPTFLNTKKPLTTNISDLKEEKLMDLEPLKKLDNLRSVSFEGCNCFIHEDHRWVLPVIHDAQVKEILPKPCTIIIFDAHHDASDPICPEDIRELRKSGFDTSDLIDLCKNKLKKMDDDWLKAGMELGLIDDVVIFGVDNYFDKEKLREYEDHCGVKHRIEMIQSIISELSDNQGDLNDLARSKELCGLWDILGWEYSPEHGFMFSDDKKSILLDIDLDCFAVFWREYHFPWPHEVFENEFFRPSQHSTTSGWNAAKFLEEFISRAALITIAEEPDFCGGIEKSNIIFDRVNKYLFQKRLSIEAE